MTVSFRMKWNEIRCCGHIVIIIINILSYRDKLRNITSIDTKKLAKIPLTSSLLHKESWNYAACTRDISLSLSFSLSRSLSLSLWHFTLILFFLLSIRRVISRSKISITPLSCVFFLSFSFLRPRLFVFICSLWLILRMKHVPYRTLARVSYVETMTVSKILITIRKSCRVLFSRCDP